MTAPRLTPAEKPRLKAQCRRIMAFYLQHPGGYFTLAELCRATGAISEAGMSARLRELTGDVYGWRKDKRKRARNLWEYKLSAPGVSPQLELLA